MVIKGKDLPALSADIRKYIHYRDNGRWEDAQRLAIYINQQYGLEIDK